MQTPATVLSDAALPFEPLYFENGLELDAAVEEGIFVRGSADHLRRVAEILLDNARKYTPEGGTVTLGAEQKEGGIRLLWLSEPPSSVASTAAVAAKTDKWVNG